MFRTAGAPENGSRSDGDGEPLYLFVFAAFVHGKDSTCLQDA
jgi:hypothetical protein